MDERLELQGCCAQEGMSRIGGSRIKTYLQANSKAIVGLERFLWDMIKKLLQGPSAAAYRIFCMPRSVAAAKK